MVPTSRRAFLASAAGAAITRPLDALRAAVRRDGFASDVAGYGPLRPCTDEATGLPLLQLPEGFRYVSFGWTGDPLADGGVTPASHDGMAAFPGPDGAVRLVRNHELAQAPAFAPSRAYDHGAGGGTTTIVFNPAKGAPNARGRVSQVLCATALAARRRGGPG